jgi:hypothetical protein
VIHTIILITLLYAALKALFKRKPKDFMEGRLVGAPTHAASEMRGTIEESTRLIREQLARTRELALAERDRIDAHRAKQYYADIAKQRAKFERDLI